MSMQATRQAALDEAKPAGEPTDDLGPVRGIIASLVLAMLFWICIGLLIWCAIE